MFARLQRLQANPRMQMIRCSHDHSIDIVTFQHAPVIGEEIGFIHMECSGGPLEPSAREIANRSKPHVGFTADKLNGPGIDVTVTSFQADDGNSDSVIAAQGV